jgi:hypothetical protein
VLLAKYNWNDRVKGDEIERACSKHRRADEWIQNFNGKNLERDHKASLEVDERITLK